MKKFTLISREDLSTGELGYMLDGVPLIDYPMVAADSYQIAHDLLEHVNGLSEIGSIDDELEALGGVWFVRGQHGQLRRDGLGSAHTNQVHLVSDLVNLGVIFNNGVDFRSDVPDLVDCEYLEEFEHIIEKAIEDIELELDEDERDYERLKYYFKNCLNYMISGYNKAEVIYSNYSDNPFYANNLFFEIVDTLKDYMNPEYEGHELYLYIDYDECSCRVEQPDE